MQAGLRRTPPKTSLEEKLQYYRAQMIIARKVTKILGDMQYEHDKPVFLPVVFAQVFPLRYIPCAMFSESR